MPDASDNGRLRVLTLVDHLGTSGGGERLAMEMVRRLDRDRFDRFYCISRWDEGACEDEHELRAVARLRDEGVHVMGLGRQSTAEVWRWRPLVRVLREEDVHVLHSHKFGSNVWAAAIAPAARVPVFLAHEHSWSYEGRPVRRMLDRHLIARSCDRLLAVSEADRRRMIAVEHIPPESIVVVPNGIDPLPPADGARIRTELGLSPEDPVVGAVALLRREKGLELLVRAIAALVGDIPRLRVVVAGDGPERAPLEALAAELGVAEHLRILGIRSDVPDVLAAIDVAVNCSVFEGTPLAILEYMDAALPIVATRVGGVPDILEDGRDGVLVESGDVSGFASSIANLLNDRERARSLGERARVRRREHYDLTATVRRIEGLYQDLVAAAGSRR
ncbi:MAG: glycosyltransferase [Actinobacteria bacterium]|nr:glycosyltransferase [Actinomycetota bacterium]